MIKIYGYFFVVFLSFFKITSTSPTDYNPAKDGAVSLREAMYLKQRLLQQKQHSESKDIARALFLFTTSTSPPYYNPAKDGAVSLREAMYLKQGLLQQKQRLESKDIARGRIFISEEWDYDEQGRPRHIPTGKIHTKEPRRPRHHPFSDYMTKKRKRRRKRKNRE